ncbi:MAG: hypothetical protein CVU98_06040 [Firmicutes bacterium HGW-Firmicutes-3]|jgi:type I restriction enzyme S subunit|nr:MAG: hypothetical protein CVU98_06040 [Firmicutes bacterium HGW-Firmicutes-3]
MSSNIDNATGLNTKVNPFEVNSNWVWSNFGELFDIQGGTQPPKSQFLSEPKENYVRLIQIRDYASDEYLTYVPSSKKLRLIEENEIAIARYGASIGRICTGKKGAYNVALAKVIYDKKVINRDYVYWWLKSDEFQNKINKNSRTAVAGFNKKDLSDIPFAIPPFPEQQRIVNRIESLFEKIDKAENLINEAREGFEKRKEAILAAAFRGELTQKWRKNNKTKLECITNEDLFEYKKKRHLDECNIEKCKGLKIPKKPKTFNSEELDNRLLPESWRMISFSEAIYDFKYGTSEKSDYENVGTPVLRIPNIGNGICDISDLKYAVGEIDSSLRVNKNDILVIRSNGSKELVGKANLVTEEVNGYAFASYLIRIRYVGIYPEFLAFMLNSSIVRNQFFLKSKSSVGINNINTQQLASIQIPLPSYDEQVEIATILERFLSNENRIVDNILNEVDTNIMKKAILAKAFRGELGTNDSVESVDYLMRCK